VRIGAKRIDETDEIAAADLRRFGPWTHACDDDAHCPTRVQLPFDQVDLAMQRVGGDRHVPSTSHSAGRRHRAKHAGDRIVAVDQQGKRRISEQRIAGATGSTRSPTKLSMT